MTTSPTTTKSQSLKYASYPDGLDMYLEYIVPEKATPENKAPIYLWFHGGGLLQGTRYGHPHHWASAPEKHGLCVVSPDYRLAPQARLPSILEDCANVMTYLRSEEFDRATGGKVDQSRICISGGSAGGWLALLTGMGIGFEASGLKAPAPPTSIAAIYPISDLNDPFWHTKQHPVSYMPRIIKEEELTEYLDANKPVSAFSMLDSPRSMFYHYMIQEALLEGLLLDGTGIDPSAYSVAPAIKNGTAPHPNVPTFVVHGTIDDKVNIEQADDVVNAMKAKGLSVEYERIEGADHLFDRDEKVDMAQMYAFVKKTLGVSA